MTWPVTVRGWLELVMVVLALCSAIGGGGWALHKSNAYASDIDEVEQMMAEGLKGVIEQQRRQQQQQLSNLCQHWLAEITMLEAREASGDLSAGQRDRLIFLGRQYDDKCGGE